MGTVDPGKLRIESLGLLDHVEDPKAFLRALDRLFEKYASRKARQGKIKKKVSRLRSLNVPNTVLKQIQLVVNPEMQLRSQEAIPLLDELWSRNILEQRLLAVRLLGALPHEAFDEVVERIVPWVQENRDDEVLEEIAVQGTKGLREQDPKTLVDLAGRLFKKKELRPRAAGLLALKALLDKSSLVNLPPILRLLSEISVDPPKDLRPYLLNLYAALIEHSPGEALFFLQERLVTDPSEGTLWVARQTLKLLGPDRAQVLQESLDIHAKNQARNE